MGQVIYLDERRAERLRPTVQAPPAFFFDVTNPLSYLMAERVERQLGEVDWVPADGTRLHRSGTQPSVGEADTARASSERSVDGRRLRSRAEACARALRLPLVWPDRFAGPAPRAQRACAFACEIGAGDRFALAASRLAFCGGFDLEDPGTLAEAAAAAGVPLEECLIAAGESWRDEELEATAVHLHANGIAELPTIRVGHRWIQGEFGLVAAAALLSDAGSAGQSLAPMG